MNRGGLLTLNDSTFHLFIEMEKCIPVYLLKHLTKSKSDEDSFQHSVHNKVLRSEDVQFHLTLLSKTQTSSINRHSKTLGN